MPQNIQQREELHKTIWAIANSLRGAIDGWEFKSYVLCSIFYRFISENMQQYIDHLQELAGVKDFDYSKLDDSIAETVRTQMVQEKGYFILPSQLFCNVCKTCRQNENLNLALQKTFREIEASAQGTPSEDDVRGLFSDFAVNNSQLGQSVQIRNQKLADVLLAVRDMDLHTNRFEDNEIDTFGDTYEFLMKMYASNAGKSGGEFYTPQEVSELLAELASINNEHIDSVYDPACGSGSLLMKFSKTVGKTNPELKYYGQEINPTTYNLCRINMFLHNINFSNFDIKLGDTLLKPMHKGMKFDAIVSNPPYSLPWIGKENPLLINDERYAPASVLAPASKSDLAFTMHMLYHLKEKGTCAIVEYPGILYRTGDEQKIRQYLVSNNYVDTIIQLPENLFYGVTIATCVLVLKKSAKKDSNILFIDASKLFDKMGNTNVLSPKYRQQIEDAFIQRKDIRYFCRLVSNDEVLDNDSNLAVASYVEKEDTREKIDIDHINSLIRNVIEGDGLTLRKEVNKILEASTTDNCSIIEKLLLESCPSGVKYKKIGDICEILDAQRKPIAKGKRKSGKYPYYGANGILDYVDDYIFDGTFLLIGEDGSVMDKNKAPILHWAEGKIWVNNHAHILKEKQSEALLRYIYYILQTTDVSGIVRGTPPKINQANLRNISVPIPPVEVQKEIVLQLDAITDLLNNIQKEQELRQQQYEYYRAKLISLLK